MGQFLTIIATLILLLSCGSESKGTLPNSQTVDTDNVITFEEEDALRNAFNSSSVYCDVSGRKCPNNVAKLTFAWKEKGEFKFGVCSGTLIENQYIVTNSHCIPPTIRRGGTSCRNRIVAHFPSTNTTPSEKVDCQRVIQAYPVNERYPDMAVIKMNRPSYSRQTVKTLKNAFSHEQELHAFTMDPVGDGIAGAIRKKTCQVSLDNLIFFKQDRRAANVFISGNNCNVIQGNSGSGVFNDSGEMVAVLHQKLETSEVEKIMNQAGLRFDRFKKSGIIVNVGCLKSLTTSNGFGCDVRSEGTINKYLDQKIKDYKLESLDESRIDATITDTFGVRLEESTSSFGSRHNLKTVRLKLNRLFEEASLSVVMKKIGLNF